MWVMTSCTQGEGWGGGLFSTRQEDALDPVFSIHGLIPENRR